MVRLAVRESGLVVHIVTIVQQGILWLVMGCPCGALAILGVLNVRTQEYALESWPRKLEVFKVWLFAELAISTIPAALCALLGWGKIASVWFYISIVVVGVTLFTLSPPLIRIGLSAQAQRAPISRYLFGSALCTVVNLCLIMAITGVSGALLSGGVDLPDIVHTIVLWTLVIAGVGFLGGLAATAILAVSRDFHDAAD